MAETQFADLHQPSSRSLRHSVRLVDIRFLPILAVQLVLLVGISPRVDAEPLVAQILPAAVSPKQPAVPASGAPAPAAAPATPVSLAIPLPQVADRADALDDMLTKISTQLSESPALPVEDTEINDRITEIRERAAQLDNLLSGMPDSVELRDEELYWRGLNQQFTAQRKLLTGQAAGLEQSIQKLNEQEKIWQATADEVHDSKGIEALTDRVKQELVSIRTLTSKAQTQLKQVLTLQNQLSQQGKQSTDALAKLSAAQERVRGRVFQRDSHPLWAPRSLRHEDPPIGTGLKSSAGRRFTSAADFLKEDKGPILGLVVLYIICIMLTTRLKRYASAADTPGITPEALKVFQRPYSLALILPLLAMMYSLPEAPVSVAFVFLILWLVMTLRLLLPLMERPFRPFLYALDAFTLIEGFRALFLYMPTLNREIFAAATLLAIGTLVWLIRRSQWELNEPQPTRRVVVFIAIRLCIVLLGASLLANVFGYLSLSHAIGIGVLFSAFYATAFYTVARVVNLILLTLMRSSSMAASLPTSRRNAIVRWSPHVISLLCALLWIRTVLYLLTVHGTVMEAVSSFLALSVAFGSVHFTIGDALSVVLILSLGYVLARASTFVLGQVLISNFDLERGLPYAIAKVTYYCLIILVLVAALAEAGVELNKFTVITGALGVGVGFGLQTIVNNFASGLILLFERPIRVEDTVEVGGLVGTVKRIGARACTVQTFQGAEVIVPNSNLLANQVVNWTLSSPWRRVDIPVGVAYGSNPENVIKLLVEVAEAQPGVMQSPVPEAYFMGFGDSALQFELRFWAERNDTWFRLKSDVAVCVSKALREAEIEIPFPQRDLHLRSVDGALKDALSSSSKPGVTALAADPADSVDAARIPVERI